MLIHLPGAAEKQNRDCLQLMQTDLSNSGNVTTPILQMDSWDTDQLSGLQGHAGIL